MPPPVPGTIVKAGAEVGPSGDTGSTGTPGAAGGTGAQGPTGPQGVQGYEGSLVGTISIWPSAAPPAGWLLCDGSLQSRATYPQLFGLVGITYSSGDGSTTFGLPDLRSRFVLGAGQGSGLTNRILAAIGGEEAHVLSVAELAVHAHSISDPTHLHITTDHQHSFPAGQGNHAHSISDPQHYHVPPAGTGSLTVASGAGAPQQVNQASMGVAAGTLGAAASTSIGIYANTLPAMNTGPSDRSLTTDYRATGIGIYNTGSGNAHNTMPPFIVLTYIIRASYGAPVGATIPLADTTQDGLMRKVSGLTTDFVDGSNNCQDLPTAVRNAIQLIHVRNFNAVGNPNFEIDQRTCGAGVTAAATTMAQDRWACAKTASATLTATGKQIDTSASPILLPGTNFAITTKFLRVTLTTAQATLAAGDLLWLNQIIEGIKLRELISDVHSVSLLVRSSVANLSFGMALRDQPGGPVTRSLVKLCSLPTANVWTLIPLANLNWSPSGVFTLGPGYAGYSISLGLASGSTYTAPANDTWQNGNFVGALGQSNFAASPVNSTFDIAFCQDEPGPVCNPFIDLPFEANQRECQRHYSKNAAYPNLPCQGSWHQIGVTVASVAAVRASLYFPVEMAKVPTMRWTGNSTALGNVYIDGQGLNAVSNISVDQRRVSGINLASATPAAVGACLADWDAATGW